MPTENSFGCPARPRYCPVDGDRGLSLVATTDALARASLVFEPVTKAAAFAVPLIVPLGACVGVLLDQDPHLATPNSTSPCSGALTALALYPSVNFAQRRLRTLLALHVIDRFRPQRPDGG